MFPTYRIFRALAFWPFLLAFLSPGRPAQPVDHHAFLPLVMRASVVIPGDMVLIAAAEFQMGCQLDHNAGFACPAAELPLHAVYLDAYRIDRYEVTNAAYALCQASGDCTPPASFSSRTRASYYGNPTYAAYPVLHVNWFQAYTYCAWAGKRLPSEAEWEKAARGARLVTFPWGDRAPACWLVNAYDEAAGANCVGDTEPIGSHPAGASVYGVMDLAGNVTEWVQDWHDGAYYSQSPYTDPPGPLTGTYRVMRGGNWGSHAYTLRTAFRSGSVPADESYGLGFRCAANP